MRKVTIEIDQDKDLLAVEAFLDKLGIKYHFDDQEAFEKSILTGYQQSVNGLTKPHDEVLRSIIDKYK